MLERILSELQREYRIFFLEKLKFYGVYSPAELSKEKKSEFFTEIKNDWAKYKLSKRQKFKVEKRFNSEFFEESNLRDTDKNPIEDKFQEIELEVKFETQNISNQQIDAFSSACVNIFTNNQSNEFLSIKKQIIKSEPNQEQTEDLRIQFLPNIHFNQTGPYKYPVVKMPEQNSYLKLPRNGRSNNKGYKENDFYNDLKNQIHNIEITNDVHLVIPNFSRPYEPDIVLFDKEMNLYIDIEIDEPYDGYFRYPTHNYDAETTFKQDNIRDLFFTESGWIVIRFTEQQVHKQSSECIDYVQNVINSLNEKDFDILPKCKIENQWNENQSIQWQINNYREKYLEIHSFYKRENTKEVIVSFDEFESIEYNIQRTSFNTIQHEFDKDLHKYVNDNTGNAEFISVTNLIERFFQFDLIRYIERKAKEENRTEEEVLDDFLSLRIEAAATGTHLHEQIENYLKNKPYDCSILEFDYFLNFEKEKIIPKGLKFIEAEKQIFYPKYNVAGTVDCLFTDPQGNWIMMDWKRSKKLIVKGTNRPDKRGFPIDIDNLKSLTNSSYYRYCIQQNMYKIILEEEYQIKISEMILVVLHESYNNYHTIKLPELPNETNTIFKSINHKI